MTGESIFNIFTKSVLQDLLKKLKIEFTKSWKKDKLVELLCEGDLKKALNKMTTEQLKVILGEMNLSQSGNKSILSIESWMGKSVRAIKYSLQVEAIPSLYCKSFPILFLVLMKMMKIMKIYVI